MIRSLFTLLTCCLFAEISAAPSQVDALTAATMNKSCKITSLTATSSSFTVEWDEKYLDGSMVMQYGTTNPPTTSKNVSLNERVAGTVTISNLLPATKYYVVITANKSGENSYGANGNVTTLPSTAVRQKSAIKSYGISVMKTHDGITATFKATDASNGIVTICNARGEVIFSKRIVVENGSGRCLLSNNVFAPGTYLMSIKAGSRNFNKQIIINQ
jgi:hypothetical protein